MDVIHASIDAVKAYQSLGGKGCIGLHIEGPWIHTSKKGAHDASVIHVPDINDFVAGLKIMLKPEGVITIEFPHLMEMIDKNQFDTIYHEHFSYLSFGTVSRIFQQFGLKMFDVQQLPTHGGSLRIFACHDDDFTKQISPNVEAMLEEENSFGLNNLTKYQDYQAKSEKVKNEFLAFLLQAKKDNKRVVAYGAAAKGNTLLNFCGVRKDLISFVVDASPHKMNKFLPGIHIPVVNEDQIRQNKPDFVVRKNDIPILYIETKDIGCDLNQEEKSEQLKRYFGYGNLILTDYLEFRFYRFGQPYSAPIKIGKAVLKTRNIEPKNAEFSRLAKAITEFTSSLKEPIRTGKHLAKIMAGKAQRIRDNIISYLGRESDTNIELSKIFEIIKKLLVHDLHKEKFADMYAQTLIYGLFVARFYDETKDDFSRQEARDLIPKTSPFLRQFFDHIVGPDFDKRLEIIVNELCEVFSHTDIDEMMKEYFTEDLLGNEIRSPDPVIHFYEDFLNEYDPELRKKMGAYYTPSPVVNFIVKSTDLILKRNFKLENGICNIEKTKDGKHKVQILDPATGTGTFICSLIRFIYKDIIRSGQKGRWPQYVHHDLLPRIYGFEVMMAPYTIAHLKLAMAFRETGFKYFNNRLGIYLTNSLEDAKHEEDLFSLGLAQTISEESIHAEKVKKETPIMVVIGNPPYSGESSNLSYNENNVYKREPSGGPLKEQTIKWLNDDYVKFIRFAKR
jgi:type I restriction-modification system DNA methylase subunit